MAAKMYLADLITLARDLCFQETTDNGLFTDTSLGTLIQIEHRRLYGLVAKQAPSYIASVSSDKSITSSGYDFSGTSLDSSGVLKILKVEHKDSSGNYVPVAYRRMAEVGIVDGPCAVYEASDGEFAFTARGEKLFTVPSLSTTQTIRVTYVPVAADISGSVYPFGGALAQYHYLIGFGAADRALAKDGRKSVLHGDYLEMRKEFTDHLAAGLVQGGRRVLVNLEEDYF